MSLAGTLPRPPTWRILLTLGRVSNLPTVWTNVWAGALLGGAKPTATALAVCGVAVSASYVGGMFLNDAFDHELDREQRPERPIPAGLIAAPAVFRIGFALLAAGTLGVLSVAALAGRSVLPTLFAALALATAIVLYDVWHKGNPLAPFVMGLCRGLVYVTSALALGGDVSLVLCAAALSLGAYVVGLTFVARHETQPEAPVHWPVALVFAPLLITIWLILGQDRPPETWLGLGVWLLWVRFCLSGLLRRTAPVMRSVIHLIAGISLLDAAFAAIVVGPWAAAVGMAATAATLYLQRVARGT